MVTVRVDGVSKRYRLGPASVPLRTLIPFASRSREARTPPRDVWALRGVTFEASAGSVLGIVGANGAGKSTLLKVLARVTRPTAGRVELRGRVVPLLDLGGTFQPDASGRDNVYLTASFYGVPRHVVRRRMDEIVDFAGIGDQIDAPVRTYSSGMYLRLAFSVATSLEPDVLVADEVLSVGDLEFQRRCAQRIADGAAGGLTVIMVSHDLASVRRLCDRALWIAEGCVVADGPPADVVEAYEQSVEQRIPQPASSVGAGAAQAEEEHANEFGEIVGVSLVGPDDADVETISVADEARIRVAVRVDRPGIGLRCILVVSTAEADAFRAVQPEPVQVDARGIYELDLRLPAHLFAETTYSVETGVWIRHDGEERREDALVLRQPLSFRVVEAGPDPTRGSYGYALPGVVRPLLEWSTTLADRRDEDDDPAVA